MKTLRKQIEEAAFWNGWTCLSCGCSTKEEDDFEEGDSCEECGKEGLIAASRVSAFLDRVEAEEPGAD